VFAGVEADMEEQVEWGLFQKLGDKTTRKEA
jgi:photosystem II CP47 chlorophyll apoprotein